MNKAAMRFGVKQPSVSNAIRDLEQELGVCLFERTYRGMRLTRQGEEFLNAAALLTKRFRQLEERYGVASGI